MCDRTDVERVAAVLRERRGELLAAPCTDPAAALALLREIAGDGYERAHHLTAGRAAAANARPDQRDRVEQARALLAEEAQ